MHLSYVFCDALLCLAINLRKCCLDKCFLHPQQLCLVEDELTHGTHHAHVGAQTVVALAALDGVKPCLAYFGFRQKLAHADTVCRQHLCQHLAEAAVVRFKIVSGSLFFQESCKLIETG